MAPSSVLVATRYLMAGLLEPPPRMVEAVGEWVMASAAVFSDDPEWDPYRSSEFEDPWKGTRAKVFPVDLRGWRYEKLVGVDGPPIDKIKVEVSTAIHTNGFWRERENLVGIDLPVDPPVNRLFYTPLSVSEIQIVVRHELTHFTQTLLKLITKANTAGVPSKSRRTPEYNEHVPPWHPQGVALHQRLRSLGYDAQDFHALDDLEFYTRLADATTVFKLLWEGMDAPPDVDLNTAVKLFAGMQVPGVSHHSQEFHYYALYEGDFRVSQARDFFKALSHGAQGKYRKAVTELYKAARTWG